MVISKSFLTAFDHLLDSEGLIDADDDPGCVEHEEDKNCDNENQREVEIFLVLVSSYCDSMGTYNKMVLSASPKVFHSKSCNDILPKPSPKATY